MERELANGVRVGMTFESDGSTTVQVSYRRSSILLCSLHDLYGEDCERICALLAERGERYFAEGRIAGDGDALERDLEALGVRLKG